MSGSSGGISQLTEELTVRVNAWWYALTHPNWNDVWRELAAHKLWYATWAGLFLCTYLMLRMLITRWGDTNVTRKALVLSLLLHTVGGLFTTSVHIATHVGEGQGGRDFVAIRNVIVENSSSSSLKNRGTNSKNGAGKPGDRAVWDQLPNSPPMAAARQAKPSTIPGTEVAVAEPSRPAAVAENSFSRLPDLSIPPAGIEASAPAAAVKTTTARVAPLLATGTPAAPEESGTSRPESTVGEGGPARHSLTPGTIGVAAGADTLLPTRRGTPTEVVSTLPGLPQNLLGPATPGIPQPGIRRGADARPPAIKPSVADSEGTGSGTGSGIPEGDPRSSAVARGKPSGGSPFARMSRPGSSSSGEGTGSGDRGPRGKKAGTESGVDDGEGIPAFSRRPGAGGAGEGGNLVATLPGSGSLGGGGAFPGNGLPGVVRAPGGGGGRPGFGRPGGGVPSTYQLRGPEQRKRSAVANGGTSESEKSVELSLKWLAAHQNPAGFWDADGFDVHCPAGNRCGGRARLGQDPLEGNRTPELHQQAGLEADAGVTALAILAFLGAGYQHEEGPYADNIDHALQWLVRNQGADGFLGGNANRYGRMYCHGMATIAIGEAYGMTHDNTLREPLAKAIQFTLDAQNQQDGGWRYLPGQISDMSLFGWQLMGLKSAQTAGLEVPKEATDRCVRFLLDQGQMLKAKQLSTFGGLASYRKYQDQNNVEQIEPPKPSMTAEALFCKQILGIKRTNPAVGEAVAYLEQNPPRRATEDLYYWYYGTLAMYHHGGPSWQRWNETVRELLINEQRKDGHAAGSWDPRTPWGDFGGRVFSTALSTLTLEVYYRFLPMYRYDEKGQPPQPRTED